MPSRCCEQREQQVLDVDALDCWRASPALCASRSASCERSVKRFRFMRRPRPDGCVSYVQRRSNLSTIDQRRNQHALTGRGRPRRPATCACGCYGTRRSRAESARTSAATEWSEWMADEKDRLGDKLRDAEKGRKSSTSPERDRELLEKLRAARQSEVEDERQQRTPTALPELRRAAGAARRSTSVTRRRVPGVRWHLARQGRVAKRWPGAESEGWFARWLRREFRPS